MQKIKNGRKVLWIGSVLLFLYLPMVMMAIFSFNDSKSLSRWDGFSLRWYIALLHNPQMLRAIFVSVSIALLATLVATI